MTDSKENDMRTTWTVTKVTATPNLTLADLQRVEWYKPNPAWDTDDEAVEEFIDAEAGEPGASHVEAEGTLHIEITEGLDLKPGDNVLLTLSVLEHVPA